MSKLSKPLRVVTGNACFASLRFLVSSPTNLEVAVASCEWAAAQKADVILFPGGYIRYRDMKHLSGMMATLHKRTKHLPLTILVGWSGGYDYDYTAEGEAYMVKNGYLTEFFSAWGPKIPLNPRDPGMPMRYRQRSSNQQNWKLADLRWLLTPRVIPLGKTNRKAELLLCGEVFCPRVKQAIAERASQADVLFAPAHVGAGLRHWQALANFATMGLPSFTSLHNLGHSSMKQAWWPINKTPKALRVPSKVPGTVNLSTHDTDHTVECDDEHWIEWKVWDVP